MAKLTQPCPWCHKDLVVESERRRLYTCPFCNNNFSFVPSDNNDQDKPAAQPSHAGIAQPSRFVETPFLKELVDRTLAYIQEGLHVHLCGPAGSGKTTLALYVAQQLGRSVVLVHGDDEMGTADLVGKDSGYKRSYLHDEYIHSVLKVEEEVKPVWVGRALTEACQKGCTVVYDEFTRSRPEANNVLLSVLEERVLPLRGKNIPVHADFRIIFTSNPDDYAGVHGVQDALLDRMVTIILSGFDQDTEIAITQERSGLPLAEVERIIALVRNFRDAGLKTSSASIRPAILISRILRVRSGHAYAEDSVFIQTCRDVLLSQARRTGASIQEDKQNEETLLHLIQKICSVPLPIEEPTIKQAFHEVEPDNLMAELGEDKEVQELLLRKIREKGLAGKLLTELLKG
ncbi:MAG: gas vesicle protein GvpN [Desulfomonile sp.]|jgi:gas vesicle protein GvpN